MEPKPAIEVCYGKRLCWAGFICKYFKSLQFPFWKPKKQLTGLYLPYFIKK